jgi:large subunit ribosomal protein L22
MAYIAKHCHAPLKPRKGRLVMDMVRNKDVDEALSLLKRQPQRAARMIEKVIMSARANAESRGHSGEDLRVVKGYIDEGMVIKRFRPGSRGRSSVIRHRRAHIVVELA